MTKHYSAEQLEQVREAMPMYLSSMLGIDNLRANIPCPHPDHNDGTPSAKYYPSTHKVHCYACDRTWDVIDVARLLNPGMGFTDAVEHVADVTGIRLGGPAGGGCPIERQACRTSTHKPLARAGLAEDITDAVQRSVYALAYMPQAAEARELVTRRGFDLDEVIGEPEHLVGWCPEPTAIINGYGLGKWRRREGGYLVLSFASPVSVPEGVYRWMPYEYHYAVFRPVHPVGGVKEIKPSGVTSPLYREHLIRGMPDSTGERPPKVIICEGVFDAIAAELLFGAPAVALMGKGYSRLLDLVKDTPRECRPAYQICLDWDPPGQEAAYKIYEGLLKLGARASIIPSPIPGRENLDPNDLLLIKQAASTELKSNREEVLNGHRARDRDARAVA